MPWCSDDRVCLPHQLALLLLLMMMPWNVVYYMLVALDLPCVRSADWN